MQRKREITQVSEVGKGFLVVCVEIRSNKNNSYNNIMVILFWIYNDTFKMCFQ